MKRGKSTGKPTKAEAARLNALHDMPCIACILENEIRRDEDKPGFFQPFPTSAHHLVDKGYRKHSGGHAATLPLDLWHHLGTCIEGVNAAEMACAYGPSLAKQKKKFIERYGTERELLEMVNELLEKGKAA